MGFYVCFAVDKSTDEVYFVGLFDSEEMCKTGFNIWSYDKDDRMYEMIIRKTSLNEIDFEKYSIKGQV